MIPMSLSTFGQDTMVKDKAIDLGGSKVSNTEASAMKWRALLQSSVYVMDDLPIPRLPFRNGRHNAIHDHHVSYNGVI